MQNRLDATQEFQKRAISNYYRIQDVNPIESLPEREFGFFAIDGQHMTRHIGFKDAAALKSYLVRESPLHSYCSVAFYDDPRAYPMSAKVAGWNGSELVFDLDADHLPSMDDTPFEDQLVAVKAMTKRLVYDFLLNDFGYGPEHLRLNFSGGRGYHVRVSDPRLLRLDTSARQEIVDYIMSTGIEIGGRGKHDPPRFYKEIVIDRQVYKEHARDISQFFLYKDDDEGWKGRIRRALAPFIEQMRSMTESEGVEYMMQLREHNAVMRRFGRQSAANIYHQCQTRMADSTIRTGNITIMLNKKECIDFIHILTAYACVNLSGGIDGPVTKDTKRLLRIPGSLHGKTGFRAMPIDLNTLDEFDPLEEAISFSDQLISVEFTKDIEVRLKGNSYSYKAGEKTEVPLYLAMFAFGRKAAKKC